MTAPRPAEQPGSSSSRLTSDVEKIANGSPAEQPLGGTAPADATGASVSPQPRWVTADMQESWHRDLLAGPTARNAAELRKWADSVAYHYSRSGTLEVTACILALLDALDASGDSRS